MYKYVPCISACKRNLNRNVFLFQNKYMMAFGATAFTLCLGYMVYMRETWKKEKVYTVINENDELVLAKKKSRWD